MSVEAIFALWCQDSPPLLGMWRPLAPPRSLRPTYCKLLRRPCREPASQSPTRRRKYRAHAPSLEGTEPHRAPPSRLRINLISPATTLCGKPSRYTYPTERDRKHVRTRRGAVLRDASECLNLMFSLVSGSAQRPSALGILAGSSTPASPRPGPSAPWHRRLIGVPTSSSACSLVLVMDLVGVGSEPVRDVSRAVRQRASGASGGGVARWREPA